MTRTRPTDLAAPPKRSVVKQAEHAERIDVPRTVSSAGDEAMGG